MQKVRGSCCYYFLAWFWCLSPESVLWKVFMLSTLSVSYIDRMMSLILLLETELSLCFIKSSLALYLSPWITWNLLAWIYPQLLCKCLKARELALLPLLLALLQVKEKIQLKLNHLVYFVLNKEFSESCQFWTTTPIAAVAQIECTAFQFLSPTLIKVNFCHFDLHSYLNQDRVCVPLLRTSFLDKCYVVLNNLKLCSYSYWKVTPPCLA